MGLESHFQSTPNPKPKNPREPESPRSTIRPSANSSTALSSDTSAFSGDFALLHTAFGLARSSGTSTRISTRASGVFTTRWGGGTWSKGRVQQRNDRARASKECRYHAGVTTPISKRNTPLPSSDLIQRSSFLGLSRSSSSTWLNRGGISTKASRAKTE